jgi:hypothetical protein
MEEDMRGRDVEPARAGDYMAGDCELRKYRPGDKASVNAAGNEIEQDASFADDAVSSEMGLPVSPRGSRAASESEVHFDAVAERPAS